MRSAAPSRPGQRETAWATGLTMFAGVLMIVGDICHAFAGLAANLRDEVHLSRALDVAIIWGLAVHRRELV